MWLVIKIKVYWTQRYTHTTVSIETHLIWLLIQNRLVRLTNFPKMLKLITARFVPNCFRLDDGSVLIRLIRNENKRDWNRSVKLIQPRNGFRGDNLNIGTLCTTYAPYCIFEIIMRYPIKYILLGQISSVLWKLHVYKSIVPKLWYVNYNLCETQTAQVIYIF